MSIISITTDNTTTTVPSGSVVDVTGVNDTVDMTDWHGTGTINGDGVTINITVGDDIVLTGNNDIVYGQNYNYVTNTYLWVEGANGQTETIVDQGTQQGIDVEASDDTLNLYGVSSTSTTDGDTIFVEAGASVTLSGNGSSETLGDVINVASGASVAISRLINTLTVGNNDSVSVAAGETVLGNNDQISLGSGDSLSLGAGVVGLDTIILGSGDGVSSTNDTIDLSLSNTSASVSGSGDTINISGSGDTLNLAGSTNTVNISDGTVNFTDWHYVDTINGSNNTIQLYVGDDIVLTGNNNIVDGQNYSYVTNTYVWVEGANGQTETIVDQGTQQGIDVEASDDTLNLYGVSSTSTTDGDTIFVEAGASVTLSGNGSSETLGDVINVASGASVAISRLINTLTVGNNDSVSVAAGETVLGNNDQISLGSGDSLSLGAGVVGLDTIILGSGDGVSSTNDTIDLSLSNTSASVSGSGDTINISGSGDTLNLAGSTNTVNISDGTVNFTDWHLTNPLIF